MGKLTVIVLVVLIAGPCWSWTGECVEVIDGDSIRVMHDGKKVKVRLLGMGCPELGKPYGEEARQFTYDLVFGKEVEVVPTGKSWYGETLAVVLVDGRNLNQALVCAGLACWLRKHAPADDGLENCQMQARQARIGVWSLPSPSCRQ